ncbi:MAG: hypothetical protein JXA14_03390, partial [Anaerolineae bacterium]|nr:hypothetical protein [Anaerolineae bacterium]
MKNQNLRLGAVVFAALMLLVAALACNPPGTGSPVAPPDTVTPYRAPGTEATELPTVEPTVPSGTEPTAPPTVVVVETPLGGGGSGPNLVITAVMLSTNTPTLDGWVVVEVTVQNQG